jgi:two-component system chemotaxis response regulator CheY
MVDLNMPEMGGVDLVAAVRRDSSLKDVRLMMVSTDSEMSEVQRALTLGANEYVMKPFTKAVINDKLRLLGFDL